MIPCLLHSIVDFWMLMITFFFLKLLQYEVGKTQHLLDSVYFVSNGRLTSYNGDGVLQWQTKVPSTWAVVGDFSEEESNNPLSFEMLRRQRDAAAGAAHGNHHFIPGLREAMAPSLTVMKAKPYEHREIIVAVGDQEISLVTSDGHLIASQTMLDSPTLAYPIYGDFNNDGFNDIILYTRGSYVGYELHRSDSSLMLPLMAAVLFVVFIVKAATLYRKDGGSRSGTSMDPKRK
eukprot:TRINITY_DN7553_c0_g2_i3.p1 TRINITY_DN7553_c0_g2~~TRINITY_DN7553_c0_g2_i3.p1  ORF type:complete len:233 (+),score=50.79 TRINITY_DN7553_c0_g2_i3:111-809(+)